MSAVFTYYFELIPAPFEEVEGALLEALEGAPDAAGIAYRRGEELRARLGPGRSPVAKAVRLSVGEPLRGPSQTSVPVTWEATGPAGLFPKMEADLSVSKMGEALTHVSFRGSYRPPLKVVGRILDRSILHRVAEASVKDFVDRLVAAMRERLRLAPAAAKAGA